MKCFLIVLFFSLPLMASPKIHFLGVNKPEVLLTDSLRFTLVVSDPQGEAIVGAILMDPLKNLPLGAFQSGSQKSALQLDIPVSDVLNARGWDPYGDHPRELRVVVYNTLGEAAEQTIAVNLKADRLFDYFTGGKSIDYKFYNYQPLMIPFKITPRYEGSGGLMTPVAVERIINGVGVKGLWSYTQTSKLVFMLRYFYFHQKDAVEHDFRLDDPKAECRIAEIPVPHFAEENMSWFNSSYGITGNTEPVLFSCFDYYKRLANLCQQIGGGITSHVVDLRSPIEPSVENLRKIYWCKTSSDKVIATFQSIESDDYENHISK